MIEVQERIVVDGAPRTVWEIVSDPTQVASCINGCELGAQREDGSYDATIGIKFGGIRVRFRTVVKLEVDDETLTGELRVTGADQQGATRIGGTANFEVQPIDAARSAVELSGSLDINGKLATLIASGANVVVGRMTREFTECLSMKLSLTAGPAGSATSSPDGAPQVLTATPPQQVATTTGQPTRPIATSRLQAVWTALLRWARSKSAKRR